MKTPKLDHDRLETLLEECTAELERLNEQLRQEITQRKQIEDALRESEQRLRLMVENLPAGAVYREGDAVFLNKAAEEITGCARTELTVDQWFDAFYGPDAATARGYYEQDRSANFPAPRTVPVTRKDGQIRWVEFAAYKYDQAEVWMLHDVTERKHSEATLKREKETAQRYLDIAGVMFVVIDRDGQVVLINNKGCNILGYSEKEILGKNWFDHFLPERLSEQVKAVFEVLMRGDVEPTEFYENLILTNSGEERLMAWHNAVIRDERGKIVETLSSGTDITERKQAEEALEESEAKTRTTLETIIDGIITIDEQGRIDSFNPAAEHIFGYQAGEVIGHNVKVLMPAPYHEEHDGYIRNYLETGHAKIMGIGREVIGQRKDGSIFPMDLAVSEVRLDGRRLFIGVVRDITERRRLEKEVVGIGERERQRIGQELHDGLGSHLTGVGLITKSLARKLEADDLTEAADEVAEIAELIKEADYQARNIARGLVPVAPDPGGLRQALHRLTTNANRLFGVSCTFEENGEVLLEDSTTATHLYRIAQEAVSNAVKHGQASHITIRLVGGDGHEGLELHVVDNGVGLPEALPEDRGIGMRTMQYRAHLVGASLSFERASEGGTVVSCKFHPMESVQVMA